MRQILLITMLVATSLTLTSQEFYYAFDEKITVTRTGKTYVFTDGAMSETAQERIRTDYQGRIEMIDSLALRLTDTTLIDSIRSFITIRGIFPEYITSSGTLLVMRHEVVLKFKPEITDSSIQAYLDSIHATLLSQQDKRYVLTPPKGISSLDFANRIYENGKVIYAHPNFNTTIQPTTPSSLSTYAPFLNRSEWLSTSITIEGNANKNDRTANDTVINNRVYRQITRYYVNLPGLAPDPITGGVGLTQFFREDTFTKKVWRLAGSEEVLFYDFGLQVRQPHPTMAGFTVTTLDTVTIAAGVRNRITFSHPTGGRIVWIEGVGNISDPFSPNVVAQPKPGLICSYQQGQVIYDEGAVYNLDCNALLTSTTASPIAAALSVFPNPTDGTVYIQVPALLKADRIQVYDTAGRILQSFSEVTIDGTYRLNLAGLPAGVYLIRLQLPQEIITAKVQKQ